MQAMMGVVSASTELLKSKTCKGPE